MNSLVNVIFILERIIIQKYFNKNYKIDRFFFIRRLKIAK